MKKTNLLKVFSILILSVMVIFMAKSVNAADGFTDMTNTLVNNGTSNNSSTNATTNNSANTNTSNSNTNTSNTNRTNTNTNRSNTRNSSVYNNTSLPSTGIGDSLPIAALVVVFGISAVYAYKKIKDYRNI